MISDSIDCSPIHAASSPNDLGKKKRTNRSAKLKQCKLDVRREQWLSQEKKNKVCKAESNGKSGEAVLVPSIVVYNSPDNLKMRSREDESDESIYHYNGSESPSDSPISCGSLLSSNSSSSSSGCGGSSSGNVSDDEEDGDGCLDDWEAVADALAFNEEQQKTNLDTPSGKKSQALGIVNPNQDCRVKVLRAAASGQAWKPDDVCRPQCLPNLCKAISDRNCVRTSALAPPLLCPICYEELDNTDLDFHPCSCGFGVCLFCYKRILEEDKGCPACRKPYVHNPVEGEPRFEAGSMTGCLTLVP